MTWEAPHVQSFIKDESKLKLGQYSPLFLSLNGHVWETGRQTLLIMDT